MSAGRLGIERAEQSVGRVAREVVAITIVATGRARVFVTSSILDVAQRGALIERERDEAVPQ